MCHKAVLNQDLIKFLQSLRIPFSEFHSSFFIFCKAIQMYKSSFKCKGETLGARKAKAPWTLCNSNVHTKVFSSVFHPHNQIFSSDLLM